jgi:hypothetical protein
VLLVDVDVVVLGDVLTYFRSKPFVSGEHSSIHELYECAWVWYVKLGNAAHDCVEAATSCTGSALTECSSLHMCTV